MFMIYFRTKYHVPSSSVLLVSSLTRNTKKLFARLRYCYFTLYKN